MKKRVIGNATLYLGDCMELMATLPDKSIDLAIVDPPFGGGNHNMHNKICNGVRNKSYDKVNKIKEWDNAPSNDYFNELFRVSKKCIICGGNNFNLPPSRNFIIYYKENIPDTFNMAMAEYLWTNIDGNSKVFKYRAKHNKDRFHPCQKPIELYKFLLIKYARPGWKLLDTHFGSGSIVIACNELGLKLIASEIDEEYFSIACNRIEQAVSENVLWQT
jgi:site-specific DNA-methyltransferase (adenine-specific)